MHLRPITIQPAPTLRPRLKSTKGSAMQKEKNEAWDDSMYANRIELYSLAPAHIANAIDKVY